MTYSHGRKSARWAIPLSIALASSLFAALVGLMPIGAKADTVAAAAALDPAIERYRSQLVEDIEKSINGVKKLRDSVSSGDVAAAKQAWIDARVGWERSEVFTSGFAPDLDREIDAWPNGATGFHAIETKLFGASQTAVGGEVDALLHSLSDMDATARSTKLTSQGLFDGLTRLAYEVGENKLDGGESYLSGTSLNDMRNNVDGIELAYNMIFAPVIESRDRDHDTEVLHLIAELKTMLAEPDLRKIDQEKLRALSEELVLTLQTTAPAIALARPTLELQ